MGTKFRKFNLLQDNTQNSFFLYFLLKVMKILRYPMYPEFFARI